MARLVLLAVFVAVAATSNARAGLTCDDYPGAILCEDFDAYCRDPGPYTPCASIGGNESNPKLKAIWPRNSMDYRGTLQECGASVDIEDNQQILVSIPYGGRLPNMGDEAGEIGQGTRSLVDPIILNVIDGQIFKGLGIKGKWGSQYDQFGGTDEVPIVVTVMMSSGTKSAAGLRLSNGVLELALEETEPRKADYLDREVTPADYIMVGNLVSGCLSCRNQCAATLDARGMADDGRAPAAAWPSICQSYDARTPASMCPDPANPTGPLIPCGPPYCPEIPVDKIHKVLAVGAMAMLDPNPCHCENPPKPPNCPGSLPVPDYTWHGMEVDHLAFFDGWKWRILSSKIFDPVHGIPGVTGYGDFQQTDKFGWVTLRIKTNTVDILYDSRQWITYPGDRCTPDKLTNDTVSDITITEPGSGYTSPPVVTIAPPPSGRQATATATITDGAVTAITITDVGTGYTSAPEITLEPPPSGTTATATATLGGGAYLANWVHSEAFNIPRSYLGAFNAARLGNPSSCQLCTQELRDQGVEGCDAAHWDGVSYQCTQWAGTKCHRMSGNTCGGPIIDDGSNYVSLDNLIIQGGEPLNCTGACCRADGTCESKTRDECTAVGGTFRGCGSTCDGDTCLGACCQPRGACTQSLINACAGAYHGAGSSCSTVNLCCPTPYADWDMDADVDMDDFAGLQQCLNIGGGAIASGCSCFDHNHDSAIDQADVLLFIGCTTGPAVSGSVSLDCAP